MSTYEVRTMKKGKATVEVTDTLVTIKHKARRHANVSLPVSKVTAVAATDKRLGVNEVLITTQGGDIQLLAKTNASELAEDILRRIQ